MDSDRWQRLQRLFEQALSRPAPARAAFATAACADDDALHAELQRLLRHAGDDDAPVLGVIANAAAELVRDEARGREGQRLGPWRIVAHLADGGMGAVYRAERADGRYAQQVAVKLLSPALMSERGRARLEAERRILARLDHPNIARLLDGGSTDDGVPYLVIEYVDGLPIDRWCEQQALDVTARLGLFMQVCDAVRYAHRNLVVHRDLKPGNILVDTQGRPRLLDFGIARLLDDDPGVTHTGERLLTPSHASPEQITGGAITTATDVYALGVLLYGLLAGRGPYGQTTSSPAELARHIVDTEPERPSAAVTGGRRNADAFRGDGRLTRELKGDLDNIVLMALRKEPERRYASAQELADDIQRHLAHLPVHARPATLPYRSAKFWQRHRIAVPVTAAALALTLSGASLFTWRLSQERDRALAAERSAAKAAAFTASILAGTGASEGAARQVSVLDLLDKAARRVDSELASEPEIADRMRLAIGDAYFTWGAYAQAEREEIAALKSLRTRPAQNVAAEARALTLLGRTAFNSGRLATALDRRRQALSLWRQVGDAAQRAAAWYELGQSFSMLEHQDTAAQAYRASLTEWRKAHPTDEAEVQRVLGNLAYSLLALGRLDEAIAMLGQAATMLQHLALGDAERQKRLNELGQVYMELGDVEHAERLWREALTIDERLYGSTGHFALANMDTSLSVVAYVRGHAAEAERLGTRAVEMFTRLLGPTSAFTITARQVHATALYGAGRLDEAQSEFEQVLSVRREVLKDGPTELARPYAYLALVALARGNAARAQRELRTALDLLRTLPTAEQGEAALMRFLLGKAIALQGRREEGRAIAAPAVAEMARSLPPTHWRRAAFEAEIDLPPFVTHASTQAAMRARTTLATLRTSLGAEAPAVRELEAALAGRAD